MSYQITLLVCEELAFLIHRSINLEILGREILGPVRYCLSREILA